MPKLLKDILNGVKKSKIVPGSTGSDPGVDYAPKAPNEQEFVKKHEREKHEDRVGNGDDIYQATNIKHSQANEPKHGYKKPQDKNVNEATKCNMTEEGVSCPVHEMADCSSASKKTLKEVLTKKTSAGEFIKDFQDSDNPKFAGKSKEKRKQMALGAYYAKQNEEVKLDEALTGGALIAYQMGMKHGSKGEKKIDPYKSFGVYANHYHRGYEQGYEGEKWREHKSNDRLRNEDLAVPLLGGKDNDESAEMAKTQLRALANKALHLAMQLGDEQVVEPWVQAKIAVAKDNVTAVHDYMVYGEHSKAKENEQTAPYEGGIDMSGAPRNSYPNFSVDVGRNV
jgi:hypothetical protein